MAYDIVLPSRVYSLIEQAQEHNVVSTLEVLNNCIKVGSFYIPLSSILYIKEI